ncbi:lysozyme inhibitor LprI family protein [Sphingomonas guangdongensis]|nr:lysozyme inhibitor LprI family protein [Sphingomonas guangdongensis]
MTLALIVTLASAAPAPLAAQTQMALNTDAARKAKAADRDLNQTYTALMTKASPAAKQLLRASQRHWIAFRDAECRFVASGVSGGSVQPMVVAGCMERLTNDRLRQLRQLNRCEEGDLACPIR